MPIRSYLLQTAIFLLLPYVSLRSTVNSITHPSINQSIDRWTGRVDMGGGAVVVVQNHNSWIFSSKKRSNKRSQFEKRVAIFKRREEEKTKEWLQLTRHFARRYSLRVLPYPNEKEEDAQKVIRRKRRRTKKRVFSCESWEKTMRLAESKVKKKKEINLNPHPSPKRSRRHGCRPSPRPTPPDPIGDCSCRPLWLLLPQTMWKSKGRKGLNSRKIPSRDSINQSINPIIQSMERSFHQSINQSIDKSKSFFLRKRHKSEIETRNFYRFTLRFDIVSMSR